MEYLAVAEAAKKWGISEVQVRKYCRDNRIPSAKYESGVWWIPANAKQPDRSSLVPKVEVELPVLAKRIQNQKKKRNFHGLYDYVQIYLTYSSSRMASNRLTRNQVESIFRKGKVKEAFEPIKVSDCVEVLNHCVCVDFIIDRIGEPLTEKFIQRLHYLLMFGTVDHRKERVVPGVYRNSKVALRFDDISPSKEIADRINLLISDYEKKKEFDLKHILDFHVSFEKIFPFEDGNGRIGRLIMFKECLRRDVMPFVIDDKRRKQYIMGIRSWHEDRFELMQVAYAAQERFEKVVSLCKLGEYRSKEFQDMYACIEQQLPVYEIEDDFEEIQERTSRSKKKRR